MGKKVCIIEDEKDIIRLLSFNLEREGYEVASYSTGLNAVTFVQSHKPDIVLLDVMIPNTDGFEVCRQLKGNEFTRDIPVIMLTAKSEESHIITGLELGADDYVTKPFSVPVLIARVRTILRRQWLSSSPSEQVMTFENLTVYTDRHEVESCGDPVNLTSTEFKLLHSLMLQPGRVFSRNQLINFMKGEDYYVTPKLVDVFIASLRKKLGPTACYIHTVRGVGYKFKAIPCLKDD